MQLLFSFDQDMRVEKRFSAFIQLLSSFDKGVSVTKTLIQTLARQLSSTFVQLLFSFDQDRKKLSCKLSLVNSHPR